MQVHGTPGISHTPDWAEPTPVVHNSAANKPFARNINGQSQTQNPGQRYSSPSFATPVPQQKNGPPSLQQQNLSSGAANFGMNSDRIVRENESDSAVPSSVIAQPPSTIADRTAFLHHYDGGQDQGGSSSLQTSPITFPKPRENGIGASAAAAATELPGFRNISGVSGVSTIDAPPEGDDNTQNKTSASLLPSAPLSEDESPATRFIRPPEGAFGTPAPLQTQAPASGVARP